MNVQFYFTGVIPRPFEPKHIKDYSHVTKNNIFSYFLGCFATHGSGHIQPISVGISGKMDD